MRVGLPTEDACLGLAGCANGWINGYYVERTEGAPSAVGGGFGAADVTVEVYETLRGRLLASYNQRLLKTP